MRRIDVVIGFLVFGLALVGSLQGAGNVDLPRYPSLSPDGSEIVFSWHGDLWKVSSEGGTAVRLTRDPQLELRSVWSRDGERIYYESTSSGFQNIHAMNADGTDSRRVSHSDRALHLAGVGADAEGDEIVTFSSSLEGDIYRSSRPFFIEAAGGDLIRLHDAFGSFPVLSPDSAKLLFTRGGARWSRRHYRGSDQRDVWLQDRVGGEFRQLTHWEGNDGRARWADGETIYFLSDRKGRRYNLYRMNPDQGEESVEEVTAFRDRDVWEFGVSADGSRAVVHVWDALHVVDLESNGEPRELSITAAESGERKSRLQPVQKEVEEATLSPDGETMAYISYGEVYVRNVAEEAAPRRVTRTHAREKDLVWSPDGLHLYFTSDRTGSWSIFRAAVALTRSEVKEEAIRVGEGGEMENSRNGEMEEDGDGAGQGEEEAGDEGADDPEEEEPLPPELDPKRWHDPVRFEISAVVDRESDDWKPIPSPDGRRLSFLHVRGDLQVLDLETGEFRTLVEGWDWTLGWSWSSDGRYIAYAQEDLDFNSDIWILPVGPGGEAVNISRHPDDDFSPHFSEDGKILSFLSERVNEEFDVWRVYLDPSLEAMTPRERTEYFEERAEAAQKLEPLDPRPAEREERSDVGEKWELERAYLRLERLTTLHGDEYDHEMTPSGDLHLFRGTTDKPGLFTIRWNGEDLEQIGPLASVEHLSLQGDKVVLIQDDEAYLADVQGGERERLPLEDTIKVVRREEGRQKFYELARTLGSLFYHPTMKGLDWPALADEYLALVEGSDTSDEFNYVSMRLLGELNGSHLGVYDQEEEDPTVEASGRIGIREERVGDAYRVIDVIPFTPAAQAATPLQEGDLIVAMEGTPFSPTETLLSRLEGRVGEETLFQVERQVEGESVKFPLLLTPISYAEERQLKYRDWRQEKADRVEELSGGRVGYIHIQSMNQSSLDVFERDLYAAARGKEGLIIDVRNNGGGWTTDRLLASIMARRHAYTIPRGADRDRTDGYPQDRLFIQRYSLPVNMLCNEKSFSNAEIISHAFKTLDRGTLVGQVTNGSVISTGGFQLIDGTVVRLPFRGWYLPDGRDMENNGAVPDIIVPQTPQDEVDNRDEQLQAAVENLLERLEAGG